MTASAHADAVATARLPSGPTAKSSSSDQHRGATPVAAKMPFSKLVKNPLPSKRSFHQPETMQ